MQIQTYHNRRLFASCLSRIVLNHDTAIACSVEEIAAEQSVGHGAADRVVFEVYVDWRRPGQRHRYAPRSLKSQRSLLFCGRDQD